MTAFISQGIPNVTSFISNCIIAGVICIGVSAVYALYLIIARAVKRKKAQVKNPPEM